MSSLDLQVPEKLVPIFTSKKRFIVIRGGRGSAKSWTIAIKLITEGYQRPIRVLCTREKQNSIQDSVHELLVRTIRILKLDSFYTITEKSIVGKNGTKFIYKGLWNNENGIKSTENLTYAWVEEAHSVSRKSLEYLTPTVREKDSQIIFSYNPTDEDDPVHADYTLADRDDTLKIEINYTDNKFFPDVLRKEMEYDLRTDPDKHAHKWLGQCVKNSEAQVFYGKWVIEEFKAPENTFFYFGADHGFSKDPATLIRCYVEEQKLYIDYEFYEIGCDIDHLPARYEQIPESKKFPIVADKSRPETISYLKRRGFDVQRAVQAAGSVEDGVSFMRSFEKIIIHPRCKHTIDEFRMYSYVVDKKTGKISNKLEDKNNHCFSGDTLILTKEGYKAIDTITTKDYAMTRKGFRKVLKTFNNGTKEVKKYNLSGKKLKATKDHNIISDKKINISKIKKTDNIYIWSDTHCRYIKTKNTKRSYIKAWLLEGIRKVKDKATEYILRDVAKVKQNICMLKYTKIQKVRSLKDITSIIKMAIPLITRSIICVLLMPLNILASTLSSTTRTINKKLETTLTKYDILQKRGILAKKVRLGTENTQKKQLHLSKIRNMFVCIVEKTILQEKKGQINFALTVAILLIEGIQGSIILAKFVLFAIKSLHPTNIKNRLHARGRVQSVYDIMVADQHEYFANNILVSNCIDATRYSLEALMRSSYEIYTAFA